MDPHPTNGALNDSLSEDLTAKLRKSRNILQSAFAQYEMKQMFLSFNGGKDCTVLLHLLSSHLKEAIRDLKVVYLRTSDPFPEIENFVNSCEAYYGISISTVEADASMKEVLTSICDSDKDIAACFMGSRRSDPYCENLDSFQPTDRGWPKLMRVNAMLDWNCDNVWEFLLKKKVPYCSLYDSGYTSIGNMRNTRPNPHLEIGEHPGTFLPAYKLQDDTLERAGRFIVKL